MPSSPEVPKDGAAGAQQLALHRLEGRQRLQDPGPGEHPGAAPRPMAWGVGWGGRVGGCFVLVLSREQGPGISP